MKNKILRYFVVTLFWIAVWYLLSFTVGTKLLLPSPKDTAVALFLLIKTKLFYQTIFISILNVLVGVTLGLAFALLLSALCIKVKWAQSFISPIMQLIKAVPVASFIILLWIFIGSEKVPSIVSTLMVLPVFYHAFLSGWQSRPKQLLEVAEIYRMSKKACFKYIDFPSVKPFALNGIHTALGLSWKASVAAEVIARSKNTIGFAISEAKIYIETENVFAWTFVVIVLSVGMEKLLNVVFERLGNQRGN